MNIAQEPMSTSLPSSRRKLKTLLEADLGFHGTNTNQGTHGWHPFPAKFPPQLPAHFIEGLTESGDTVLDPMLGSGTTLVEAARLGRHAIGCDIDPLARLIAAAKLAPLPADHAMAMGMDILERARRRHAPDHGALEAERDRRFDAKTREFQNYWFSESAQRELLALLLEVEALPDDAARWYFRVVFLIDNHRQVGRRFPSPGPRPHAPASSARQAPSVRLCGVREAAAEQPAIRRGPDGQPRGARRPCRSHRPR